MPRASRFPHVPDYKMCRDAGPCMRALYAAEFSNGVVKVGRTYKPRTRMAQLQRDVAHLGVRVTRCYVSSPLPERDAMRVERDICERLARAANRLPQTFEFFNHTRFGVAQTLVRQLARRSATPEAPAEAKA